MGYNQLSPVAGHESLPSNLKASAFMAGALEVLYTGINYAIKGEPIVDGVLCAIPYAVIGAAMTPYALNAIRYDHHIKRRALLYTAALFIGGGITSNFMHDGIEHLRDKQKPVETVQEEIIHVIEPTQFMCTRDELITSKRDVMVLPSKVWAGQETLTL